MSKNANGEGSIYQRSDGRWVGATYVLRPDGSRKRRQVYGRTRAEVSTKLRHLIEQTVQGIPTFTGDWTVDTYAAHWLDSTRGTLRPSTHSNYAWMLRKYILPTLGRIKLTALTPTHVRHLHAVVAATGVSARTVQLSHAVLRSMLSDAVREEAASRNVASLTRAPRREKVEAKPWSPEEVETFRLAAESHRLAPLFTLAYGLGLRRGEILGLRWSDVDFGKRLIHVRHTMQRLGAGTGRVFGPPKTQRSRRTVPMPAMVATALERQKRQQADELRHVSGETNTYDLVFTTSIGTPLEPTNLRRDFNALIVKAGVRRIRFHDLRHTCASLLMAQGVSPRVVMDVLGHSTLSVTMDLYSHVMPSALLDASRAIDLALGNDKSEAS